MGKTIRYKLLKGSLLQPYFQFVKQMDIGINPISDPRGTKIGQHYFNWANKLPIRFKGDKFKSTLQYDFSSNSSYIVFHYMNGFKHGWLLKNVNKMDMDAQHDMISRSVEFRRVLDGLEDEYEDEDDGK